MRAGIERIRHRARPARERTRTTTACSTPWNGGSSPGVSGANSIRPFTSWNAAGGNRPRARLRSEPARDRPPSARSRALTTCIRPSRIMSTSIPYDRIISTATHLSTDIDYRIVSDDEMAAAIARRGQAGPAERDCYASYVNELFLTMLEARAEQTGLPVQLRCRAASVRDGQPALAAHHRASRRDDRAASRS